MVKEGHIDQKTAIQRVSPESLNHLLLPQLDPKAKNQPVAQGIAASPGAASGWGAGPAGGAYRDLFLETAHHCDSRRSDPPGSPAAGRGPRGGRFTCADCSAAKSDTEVGAGIIRSSGTNSA